MICEIINPSDAYTLKTDDFKMACVAIAVLGNGKIGLKCGEESSPILFGWDDWLKEQSIDDLGKYIEDHKLKIADILDTVLIGSEGDRIFIEEKTLPSLQEDKRQAWLDDWHERKCSSMNDIGGGARKLAAHFRKASA